MARAVTQETFNEIVEENIKEFGMGEEEAIEEATKQLESQGADLSTIIKSLSIANDTAKVVESLKTIKNYIQTDNYNSNNYKPILHHLDIIKQECDKSIPYRVNVEKQGGYTVLIDLLDKLFSMYDETDDDLLSCLKGNLEALTALMCFQPDPLDAKGIDLALKLLKSNDELKILALTWMRVCCVMHENNRERFFKLGTVQTIRSQCFKQNDASQFTDVDSVIIQNALAFLRTFALDDDIRCEFGNAHERMKAVAAEFLLDIIRMLETSKSDEKLILELLNSMSAFLVRSDLCVTVKDNNGVTSILQKLDQFCDDKDIASQAFKLLKNLSGDDDCKAAIVKEGVAPLIVRALSKNYKTSKAVATTGLSLISMLSLRSPENSEILFDADVPEIIVNSMIAYPANYKIQQNAAWAIRNMVSRNKTKTNVFLELNAEELLINSMKKFGTKSEYDFKAALRDLGCKIHLTEEWTGKGGALTTNVKLGRE